MVLPIYTAILFYVTGNSGVQPVNVHELLNSAGTGNAIVIVAPKDPNPHIQCMPMDTIDRALEGEQSKYPNWTIVRVPLNYYHGDSANPEQQKELGDVTEAIKDTFGIKLPVSGSLPWVIVVKNGRVSGYGNCPTIDRYGELNLRFAPPVNAGASLEAGVVLNCLREKTGGYQQTPTKDQVLACLDYAIELARQEADQGFMSAYDISGLRACVEGDGSPMVSPDAVQKCLNGTSMGNNYVGLEDVLKKPLKTTRLSSQLSAGEFQRKRGK